MNFSRKNTKRYSYFLMLSGIAFLLCFAITPPAYKLNGKIFPYESSSENVTAVHKPMRQNVSYLIANISNYELLADVVLQHYVVRNIQNSGQKPAVLFDMLTVLLTAYFIIKLTDRYYKHVNDHNIPLLALSKGGHAPPQALI